MPTGLAALLKRVADVCRPHPLTGAKAAATAVEVPAKFRLIVNRQTGVAR
jgi:hypothetical protein